MTLLKFSNYKNEKSDKKKSIKKEHEEEILLDKNEEIIKGRYSNISDLKNNGGFSLKKLEEDEDDEEGDNSGNSGGRINVEVNRASGKPTTNDKRRRIEKERKKIKRIKNKQSLQGDKSFIRKYDKKIKKRQKEELKNEKIAISLHRLYFNYRRRKKILKLIKRLKRLLKARRFKQTQLKKSRNIERTVSRIKKSGKTSFVERLMIKQMEQEYKKGRKKRKGRVK